MIDHLSDVWSDWKQQPRQPAVYSLGKMCYSYGSIPKLPSVVVGANVLSRHRLFSQQQALFISVMRFGAQDLSKQNAGKKAYSKKVKKKNVALNSTYDNSFKL